MGKSSEGSDMAEMSAAEIRRRRSQLGESGNWVESIALWRAGLDSTEAGDRCGDWFTVRFNLAVELMEPPVEISEDTVEEAIALLEDIEDQLSSKECLHELTITQLALGRAFAKRKQGARYENMEEALRYYRRALRYYEDQGDDLAVAEILANIGHSHAEKVMGYRVGDALAAFRLRKRNFQEAVKCYRLALEVFTEDRFEEEFHELTSRIQILEELLEQIDRALGGGG